MFLSSFTGGEIEVMLRNMQESHVDKNIRLNIE